MQIGDVVSDIFEKPEPDLPIQDQIQFLIDQCLPGTLGITIEKLDPEESTAHVPYKRNTSGLHGLMHGGTIFSAGDTLTALQLMLHGDETTTNILTVNASIRYLRPVPDGRVKIRTRITSREGSNVFMTADFLNEAGKRVAQGKYKYLLA